MVLTSGALNMINKVDEETNAQARATGSLPQYRPVNAGTNILKQALNDAAKTPSGAKAKSSTRPTQLGLGIKHGPERMAWALHAAQLEDRLIDTDDAINAFNALLRQAVLDAVAAGWPEATQLFNKYYGLPSIVFYAYEHDGARFLRAILGREGMRMGCPLGSLGFDLAMHEFVYRRLAADYKSDEVTLRALTDDLVRMWRTPPDDDPSAWTALYARVASFKVDYDGLANPIGIFRHPGKSALVLPPRAPQPAHPTLTVTTGTTLAGRPFGSPEYVEAGLAKRLLSATARIDDVLTLADAEPAVAAKVLILCANKLLDYHVAILPLDLSDTISVPFDDAIANAAVRLLTPSNAVAGRCSSARTNRAKLLMSLNSSSGGFGLTPVSVKAPAAVLRSIIAIADEPDLPRHNLAQAATQAHRRTTDYLTVPALPAEHPLGPFLPSDPADITSESYATILSTTHPRCKLQALISSAILSVQRNLIRATMACPDLPPGVSPSDAAHILSITSFCATTRILTASSWGRANRLSSRQFVTWGRFHLNLPLLSTWGDGVALPLSDCSVDLCRATHSERKSHPIGAAPTPMFLDHNGDHACFCPSQCGARYTTHNNVVFALKRAAAQAQVTANREPSTASLLGNFYTVEQCRALFPRRKPSGSDIAVADVTRELLARLDNSPSPSDRVQINIALSQLALTTPVCGQGLRVDLQLVDEHSDARGLVPDLWCDVSCLHSTAQSHIAQFLPALRIAQTMDSVEVRRKPLVSSVDCTPIASATAHKQAHYMPLVQKGLALHATGKLSHVPVFKACIATHAGVLGAGLISTVEWLCTRYRRNSAPAAALLSGTSIAKATGCFRGRTLDAITVALAKGWAQQLLSVGHPLALATPSLSLCVS